MMWLRRWETGSYTNLTHSRVAIFIFSQLRMILPHPSDKVVDNRRPERYCTQSESKNNRRQGYSKRALTVFIVFLELSVNRAHKYAHLNNEKPQTVGMGNCTS